MIGRRLGFGLLAVAVAAALLLGLLAAASGRAATLPLATGISGMGEMNEQSLGEVKQTGAQFIRITVPWELIAPKAQPAEWQPRNPADPHYNWEFLDREVRQATAAGLTPLLLVEGAPRWAQGCQSPPNLQYVETCDPSAGDLADFATAAATRYSGSFGGLPRVRYWQGLNEPNLTLFFFPQFSSSGQPLSANLYRTLINSFYAAVKAVDPSNVVAMAGLGPIARHGWTIGPMQFAREVLCMRGSAHPKPIPGG
ncbi:MAG TPA: hypothetical protein VHV47_09560, partial [Opitutaceae bacterium]|nr:hypothetical protein [Opitutaceae bacterium]